MEELDAITLAYAAGVIDGEGYVGITVLEPTASRPTRSPAFQAVVSVGMVDLEVVAWLHQTFGGNLHSYPPGWGRMKHGVNHWRLAGKQARDFCAAVGPYLRLKGPQAATIVRYYDDPRLQHGMRGPKRLSAEEIEARREYARDLKGLNQREKYTRKGLIL